MNLIEDELRATLSAHATDAPDGAGLLGAVQTRSRAMAVRRRVSMSGIAAVTVTALVAAPYLLFQRGDASPPARQIPVATAPTATAAQEKLVPADLDQLPFPLTPTWEPAQLGPRIVEQYNARPTLSYGPDPWVTGPTISLWLEATRPVVISKHGKLTERPTTVRGKPATWYTYPQGTPDATARSVVWQLASGQWVNVWSDRLSDADLRRYVDGLVERPLPATPLRLRPGLAPVGYRLEVLSPQTVGYGRAGDKIGFTTVGAAIIRDRTPEKLRRANVKSTQVRIGSRTGTLYEPGGGWYLEVPLGNQELLVVQTDSAARLSRADLLRFAEAITIVR